VTEVINLIKVVSGVENIAEAVIKVKNLTDLVSKDGGE